VHVPLFVTRPSVSLDSLGCGRWYIRLRVVTSFSRRAITDNSVRDWQSRHLRALELGDVAGKYQAHASEQKSWLLLGVAICFSQVALLDRQMQAPPSWDLLHLLSSPELREANRKIRLITSLGVPCLSHFITPLSLPPTLCSTPDVDLAFLPRLPDLEMFRFLTTRASSRLPACFVGFSMVLGTDGGGAAVDELDIPGG
jgi:hypothetical protein